MGENFNVGIFLDTIDVINVNLCMMVLLIELYLLILPSVTLTVVQGYRHVKQLEVLCSHPIKFRLHRIVKYVK